MGSSFSSHRQSPRRRAASFLLALAINGLLLFAFLTLGPSFRPAAPDRALATFDVAPERRKGPEREEEERDSGGAPPAAPAARADPRPPAEKPPPDPPTPELPFLVLSKDQYAAADIGRAPSQPGRGQAGEGTGTGAAQGPGEGPGGAQLYDADWYRRPTNAELSTYLPANAPANGWGLVACKTVENNRVDNCQQIGESPPGSGFARAVRLAAWQFQVRPPRINGRPVIGAWVRIRIDYVQGVAR